MDGSLGFRKGPAWNCVPSRSTCAQAGEGQAGGGARGRDGTDGGAGWGRGTGVRPPEERQVCCRPGEDTMRSFHSADGNKFTTYMNFNDVCQQISGGKTPTFLVTELFHPVATIKYVFLPSNED